MASSDIFGAGSLMKSMNASDQDGVWTIKKAELDISSEFQPDSEWNSRCYVQY